MGDDASAGQGGGRGSSWGWTGSLESLIDGTEEGEGTLSAGVEEVILCQIPDVDSTVAAALRPFTLQTVEWKSN